MKPIRRQLLASTAGSLALAAFGARAQALPETEDTDA